jgi:hypothetical protein
VCYISIDDTKDGVTELHAESTEFRNQNERRENQPMKKLIALIVSLCMLVSMLPAVAETPAETKKVDMNMLIYKLLFDIQSAVVRVDMEDLKARSTATPGASDGNVFAVL